MTPVINPSTPWLRGHWWHRRVLGVGFPPSFLFLVVVLGILKRECFFSRHHLLNSLGAIAKKWQRQILFSCLETVLGAAAANFWQSPIYSLTVTLTQNRLLDCNFELLLLSTNVEEIKTHFKHVTVNSASDSVQQIAVPQIRYMTQIQFSSIHGQPWC